MKGLGRLIRPLRSRKVRVALTTVVVAYAAEFGLDISDVMVLSVIGVGVSVILGIAIEDNGAKRGPSVTIVPEETVARRNGKS